MLLVFVVFTRSLTVSGEVWLYDSGRNFAVSEIRTREVRPFIFEEVQLYESRESLFYVYTRSLTVTLLPYPSDPRLSKKNRG